MSLVEDAEVKLIEDGNEETAQVLENFETRWKYAVFPAMVAFALLSSFGFYLIYGMLQRMESLSQDVHRMTNIIEQSFPAVAADVHQLSASISTTMPKLESNVTEMSAEMKNMSTSTSSMAYSTQNMGYNLWEVNKNISKPLSVMNSVMPWSNVSAPQPRPYIPSNYQAQQIPVQPAIPVPVQR